MKYIKKIGLGITALIIIIMAMCILFFTLPTLQKKIVTFVAQRYGSNISLEYVKITPISFDATNLHFEQSPYVYNIKDLHIKGKLWQLLYKDLPALDEFVASGVTIVKSIPDDSFPQKILTKKSSLSKLKTKDKHALLLSKDLEKIWKLPTLTLKKVLTEGSIFLEKNQRLDWALEGGSIAPNQKGEVKTHFALNNLDSEASVIKTTIDGICTVEQDSSTKTKSINWAAQAIPIGPAFEKDYQLGLNSTLKQINNTTTFSSKVDYLNDKKIIVNKVLDLSGKYSPSDRVASGKINYSLNTDIFNIIACTRACPDIESQGEGNYVYNFEEKMGVLKFKQNGYCRKLSNWKPALEALGALSFSSELNFQIDNNALILNLFHARINNVQGESLLNAKLMRDFKINFGSRKSLFEDIQGDLFSLNINHLPLELLSVYLPNISLQAEDASWYFIFRAEAKDAFVAKSLEPLVLKNLSVEQDNVLLFSNLDVTLNPLITFKNDRIFSYLRLDVSDEDNKLNTRLDAEIKVDKNWDVISISNDGKWNLMLNNYKKQPFLAKSALPQDQALKFEGDYKIQYDPNHPVHLNYLSLKMYLNESKELLSLMSNSKVLIDLNNKTIKGDLGELKMDSFPLDFASFFIPKVDMSGLLTGNLKVEAGSNRSISLKSKEGIALALKSFDFDKEPIAREINLNFQPTFDWSENALNVLIKNLELKSNVSENPLVSSHTTKITASKEKVEEGWKIVRLESQLQGDLHAISSQPSGRYFKNLGTGLIIANINYAHGVNDQLKFIFNIDANHLATLQNPNDLYSVVAVGDVAIKKGESTKNQIQVLVQGPQSHSNITGDGIIIENNNAKKIEASIKSDHINISDLQNLSSLFDFQSNSLNNQKNKSLPVVETISQNSTSIIERPFWDNYIGNIHLQFKEVERAGQPIIQNLDATLALAANTITFDCSKGNALVYGAPLSLRSQLAFNVNHKEEPYYLTGNMSVRQFNLATYLSQLKPGRSPIEGIFDLTAKFEGPYHMDHLKLMETIQADINLTGGPGVLHTLIAAGPEAQSAAAILGIAGIVNAVSGNKVPQLDIATNLIRNLTHIPYTQATIQVSRDSLKNWNLSPIYVVGPDIVLEGVGQIKYISGIFILDQPLSLNVTIGAKGGMAQSFRQLGLLSDQMMDNNFYKGPSFSVKGTPSNPDFSELEKVLRKSAITASLGGAPSGPPGETPPPEDRLQETKKAIKALKGLFK